MNFFELSKERENLERIGRTEKRNYLSTSRKINREKNIKAREKDLDENGDDEDDYDGYDNYDEYDYYDDYDDEEKHWHTRTQAMDEN